MSAASLSTRAALAAPAGATVLSGACWPADDGGRLPSIPGFVASSFSPLVVAVTDRCLRAHYGDPPAAAARAADTAIVLATVHGDVGTSGGIAQAVDAGRRVPPLLLFQSVPNSVLGHVAAHWGLAGPVVCLSPVADPLGEAWSAAQLLIEDGEASRALLIVAEQAIDGAGTDRALALLVTDSHLAMEANDEPNR
jgi:hypothetical protein